MKRRKWRQFPKSVHELSDYILHSTNSFCDNVPMKHFIDNVKWNHLYTKLWSYSWEAVQKITDLRLCPGLISQFRIDWILSFSRTPCQLIFPDLIYSISLYLRHSEEFGCKSKFCMFFSIIILKILNITSVNRGIRTDHGIKLSWCDQYTQIQVAPSG